jgi:hypothetical protein
VRRSPGRKCKAADVTTVDKVVPVVITAEDGPVTTAMNGKCNDFKCNY